MKKYRVILPVEIGGMAYQFGEVIELDEATAIENCYALIAWEGEENGGTFEGHQHI